MATDGLEHFLLARLAASKLLGRHDAAFAALADKSFNDLNAAQRELDTALKAPAFRKKFDELQAGMSGYRDAFHQASVLEEQIASMINGTMFKSGQQVQTDAEPIKASGIADGKQEGQTTLVTMDRTASQVCTWL